MAERNCLEMSAQLPPMLDPVQDGRLQGDPLNNAMMQTLLDRMTVCLMMTDAEGRCVYMNSAAECATGYTLDELRGCVLHDILHAYYPDGPLCSRSNCALVDMPLEIQQIETEFIGKHRTDRSERFPVRCTMIPLLEHDGRCGALFEFRNITQEKRELDVYTRQLEESNRELEQFATLVSHDLQAPLRKISLFSGFIRQSARETLSEEAVDYFRRMQLAINKMQQLLIGLLDLSRINRKGQPFRKTDLNQVMDELLNDLEYTLRETGGRVEVGTLCTLDADAVQMKQLLHNLVENGLTFHRPGVPPVVRVFLEHKPEHENDGFCHLSVEDNGIGIQPEQLESIFQPCIRLHGETVFEGSGLGLTICRKIAERHGGRMGVASIPGSGSLFTVSLPIHHP